MLKSFVKAESILFFENFKNSFKMRSEEQALFSFKQLMLFKTSCSAMGEFISKLCSETLVRSNCANVLLCEEMVFNFHTDHLSVLYVYNTT